MAPSDSVEGTTGSITAPPQLVDATSSPGQEGLGDRISVAASFHAPNLGPATYRHSPHHKASAIRARLYVAGATDDAVFPDEQKDLLERTLTEAGVAHTIETYPGHHGFAVPDNASYDPDSAERHWKASEQLFESVLRS